ncbi:MAG: hypothetical protein Q4B50_08765, partial [Bacillota bacterium]|nr:hypothetical protein [Bacillota bacterium]
MPQLLLFFLLFSTIFCGGCFWGQEYPELSGELLPSTPPQPDGLLETGGGAVEIWEDVAEHDWGLKESKIYILPNGDSFHQIRCSFSPEAEAGEVVLDFLRLPQDCSMRRYSQENAEWFVSQLGAGQISSGQYHCSHADGSALLLTPLSYRQQENQMLEYLPEQDGFFRSTAVPDGWRLEFCVPISPGGQAECFYIVSKQALVDWENVAEQELWAGYDFTGANRWCYAGYYYLAPENYIPSGENYFHRLPAAYIAAQCVEKEGRLCASLALPMLHVMLELQNDQG